MIVVVVRSITTTYLIHISTRHIKSDIIIVAITTSGVNETKSLSVFFVEKKSFLYNFMRQGALYYHNVDKKQLKYHNNHDAKGTITRIEKVCLFKRGFLKACKLAIGESLACSLSTQRLTDQSAYACETKRRMNKISVLKL